MNNNEMNNNSMNNISQPESNNNTGINQPIQNNSNNIIDFSQEQHTNNTTGTNNVTQSVNDLNNQNINLSQNNMTNKISSPKKDNKILFIIIAIIAIIALVLITKLFSGKSSNLEIDEKGSFKSNESNIQTTKVGETATVTNDDDKFTIKLLSSPTKTEAENGDQYIELKVLVENLKNKELSTSLYFFNLTDANKNKLYSASSIKVSAHSTELEQLETEFLNANSREEGYIRYYDEYDSEYKLKTDFSKLSDVKYLEISTFYGVTNYIEIK